MQKTMLNQKLILLVTSFIFVVIILTSFKSMFSTRKITVGDVILANGKWVPADLYDSSMEALGVVAFVKEQNAFVLGTKQGQNGEIVIHHLGKSTLQNGCSIDLSASKDENLSFSGKVLYEFLILLRLIFKYTKQLGLYWIFGVISGAIATVYLRGGINSIGIFFALHMRGIKSLALASILGILSPLCLYAIIPVCAVLSRKGVKDDFLASFIMASLLLNPQIIVYSMPLGAFFVVMRICLCFLFAVSAGLVVKIFFKKSFFNFDVFVGKCQFNPKKKHSSCICKNTVRNIKVTFPCFALGILLSAVIDRYVPSSFLTDIFRTHRQFSLLSSVFLSGPLYLCGIGVIPLLSQLISSGCGYGIAFTFILAGPAGKISNLGALKIVLGKKRFFQYLGFAFVFSFAAGIFTSFL